MRRVLLEQEINLLIELLSEREVEVKDDIEYAVEMHHSQSLINAYNSELSSVRKMQSFFHLAQERGECVDMIVVGDQAVNAIKISGA